MSLLVLEHVARGHRRGEQKHSILRDVSLELQAGELVAVWGLRRCGRSTLLRIAAGIEPADAGSVRFAGHELSGSAAQLGDGIGYCARTSLDAPGVLDALLLGQLARGVRGPLARVRALAALARVGAPDCASRTPHELDGAEELRVAVARALVLDPALLVIDDPVRGVDLLERDSILALLRSLADDGIAVLISTDEATALAGADRAMSLYDGVLGGSSAVELAQVLPLRRAANA
jgi:putative ABC transport system ATP-binding protein